MDSEYKRKIENAIATVKESLTVPEAKDLSRRNKLRLIKIAASIHGVEFMDLVVEINKEKAS